MSLDPLPIYETPLPMAPASLRAYEAGLLQLQKLQADGQNDSDQADAVRDDMDGSWAIMSPDQRKLVRGLSADLYMLAGEEIRGQADGPDGAAVLDQRRSGLYVARRWAEFLELLRTGPTELSQSSIAYLRFRAYEALGLQAAAGRFIERADELTPRDTLKVLAIIHSQQSGDFKKAVRQANAVTNMDGAGPGLLIVAAGAVLSSTRGISADLAKPQWERVVGLVERALATSTIADDEQVSGLIYKGLAFEFLGNGAEARKAYADAAVIAPFSSLVRDAKAGQPPATDSGKAPMAGNVETRLRLIEPATTYIAGLVPV